MVLAGRYRLEELLALTSGAATWRGVDEVLSRPVALHLLPLDDPRAEALADAARAAAGLPDPHFLRMLDVDRPRRGSDVATARTRSWSASGCPAATSGTPWPTARSTPTTRCTWPRELAVAMASAHRAGLAHLRLEPDTVVLADNGQVKVVDLAVDRVLRGTSADDVARRTPRASAGSSTPA